MSDDHLTYSLHVNRDMASQIAAADNKANFLLIVQSLVITIGFALKQGDQEVWSSGQASSALILGAIAASLISVFFSLVTLWPRKVQDKKGDNSWIDWAESAVEDQSNIKTEDDDSGVLESVNLHTANLARISSAKYENLRRAIVSLGAAFVLGGVFVVVALATK